MSHQPIPQQNDLQFDVTHNGVLQPPSGPDAAGNMSGSMQPMAGAPPANYGGSGGGAGGSGIMAAVFDNSAHPIVCIFHVAFKASALLLYIFGGWFAHDKTTGKESGANFITVTVFCILFLAADFWVTKNITGRLLVGLRWWNKVEGDNTRWIYESAENEAQYNKFDSTVFWWVLYVTPVIWSFFLIIGVLKFELGWLINVFMAIALSLANLHGYYKCSNEQKLKLDQFMQQGREQGAVTLLRTGVLGAVSGVASGLATVASGAVLTAVTGAGQQQQQQQQPAYGQPQQQQQQQPVWGQQPQQPAFGQQPPQQQTQFNQSFT